ncbi:uncharacterized protein [Primulina eburnea]|uniref:uncharacterized protein n=1 Tax=Primulina eburnea TaxID=1245227 RepID=UPI003C6C89BE
MGETFLDAVEKTRTYVSAVFAKKLVNASKLKIGAEEAEKDPLWALLVHESELVDKLNMERNVAAMNYILTENPSLESDDRFDATIKKLEHGFPHRYSSVINEWVENYGLKLFENSMWRDMLMKRIQYQSSFVAMLNVKNAREEFKLEPLWADLVAESNLLNKFESELYDVELQYYRYKLQPRTLQNDFEERLFWMLSELETYVMRFTVLVSMWLMKYGTEVTKKGYLGMAQNASAEVAASADLAAFEERYSDDGKK